TMTAGVEMVGGRFLGMIQGGQVLKGVLNLTMTVFVMACVGALLLLAVGRWLAVARGLIPAQPDYSPSFRPPSGLESAESVPAVPSPASDGVTLRSEDVREESEHLRPKE